MRFTVEKMAKDDFESYGPYTKRSTSLMDNHMAIRQRSFSNTISKMAVMVLKSYITCS